MGRSTHVRIDSVIHVCHDTGRQEIKVARKMRKLIAVGILVGAMWMAMTQAALAGTIGHQVGMYTYCTDDEGGSTSCHQIGSYTCCN